MQVAADNHLRHKVRSAVKQCGCNASRVLTRACAPARRWVPSSARFVVLGAHARATGALQARRVLPRLRLALRRALTCSPGARPRRCLSSTARM